MDGKTFYSVWDAISETPTEAEDLKARADLVHQITKNIASHQWTSDEAATHCKITQPRMNDLLCGRISQVNLADLKIIAAAIANFQSMI